MTDKEKLEKLKKLADAMYYAAMYLTTDASRLHKAMDEYHNFIIKEYHKEEPVSEDLEEAARDFSDSIDNILGSVGEQTRDAFKAGAEWQKERMIIKACKWFNDNACNYFGHMPTYPFINDLHKAMKDE